MTKCNFKILVLQNFETLCCLASCISYGLTLLRREKKRVLHYTLQNPIHKSQWYMNPIYRTQLSYKHTKSLAHCITSLSIKDTTWVKEVSTHWSDKWHIANMKRIIMNWISTRIFFNTWLFFYFLRWVWSSNTNIM